MDRIMPIDLERAKFRKSFRGYDATQVEEIIKGSAESLQTALVDIDALRVEVEAQRHQLDLTRLQENTLKDAILLAQKAADDTRSAAQRHAEAIIEEARQAALAERLAQQQQVSELRWELDQLKAQKERFEADFKAMLDRYQRDLKGAPVLSLIHAEAVEA